VGSEVRRGSEVQHSEEERGRREGGGESEVVEAGGGHLKLAASGASSPLPPAPSTYLACDCACAVRCGACGSNARSLQCGLRRWACGVIFVQKQTACACLQRRLTCLRGAATASSIGGARKRDSSEHVGSCEARLIGLAREPPAFRLSLGRDLMPADLQSIFD
jgi:hypothetical protein